MQRIRIGLTGLAGVFLLVVLGAAIYGMVDGTTNDDAAMNGTNGAQLIASANDADPSEPLAELGVVPSSESTAPTKK